jgi:hypothetical protein
MQQYTNNPLITQSWGPVKLPTYITKTKGRIRDISTIINIARLIKPYTTELSFVRVED